MRSRHPVRAVPLSADGRRALYATEDCTIRMWHPEQRTEGHRLHGHTAPVAALAVTRDGRRLISASEDGTIRTWSTESGEQLTVIERDCSFSACAVSADGKTVFAGDTSGKVHIVPL